MIKNVIARGKTCICASEHKSDTFVPTFARNETYSLQLHSPKADKAVVPVEGISSIRLMREFPF